jgi:hypothetical protein
MNPESELQAWRDLQRHAADQIHPGFADRVLRTARSRADAMPSVLSQVLLGAATAAACAALVAVAHARSIQREDVSALADWQQIAYAGTDLGGVQ